MAIYLEIEGIPGDSTHEAHKNWMDITYAAQHSTRAISTPVGSAGNREASEPVIGEYVLIKTFDSASVKLFSEFCSGSTGKTATIHFVTTGNPGNTIKEVKLTNAMISNYSSESSGDRPTETIRLNFTKMEVKSIKYDDQNVAAGPQIAAYDLAAAKSA